MSADVLPSTIDDVEPVISTTDDEQSTKRKRSMKKPLTENTSISNDRPRRNQIKNEENNIPINGLREIMPDDEHEQEEEEKTIPISYDVADVVWVKMGGHPWWPSLIIRDPNDSTRCFTKVTGNARAKRMYFVVFYGQTADFAWVSDAAIIPYNGVESFTEYAQEMVDKAQTKSQKEQLTERFQLKVTIGRRDDWELAVKEADQSLSQTSEIRLEQIEPKIQFYTAKLGKSIRDDSSDSIDEETSPPPKRRYIKKTDESTDVISSMNSGKKRGRPRVKDLNDESSSSKKSNPVSSLNKVLLGQHHRFDIRTGFLTPYEENEVFKSIDQLRVNQTFDEAEQIARRRFEQILSINLNRTDVQIPTEWFYSFLFAHPILIVKNAHWFKEKSSSELLKDNHWFEDVKSSTTLSTLKHQLAILSKLYQNQLQIRPKDT